MAPPKTTPPAAPPADDDDWMAEGVEGDDDWMLEGIEGAADEPAAATPTGPTFYLRDSKGEFRPISKAVADRAAAMGLRPLSEAEVRGMQSPPPASTPAEAPPAKDPGLWRTLGRSALQGFFKQGADEAVGGIARATTDVGPGARYRMPDGTMRPVEQSGDLYRAVRDSERETERGARENRPVASFVANMAGDIASDAALSALGLPVTSTPYQVASGALSGFLGSDAELSTDKAVPGAATSAAASTALGGGLGYVLPKIGTQVGRALPGALASLRGALEGSALDKARKVLTAGSGQLAKRKPVSDAAAREALDSGAIPIWGTTEGAFQRLKETAETRGQTYADILTDLEAAGVQGPQVEALASRFAREGADRRANSGANKGIASVFENEAENIRTVAPRERVPVEVPPTPASATPPPAMMPPASTPQAGPVRGPDGRFLPRGSTPATPAATPSPSGPVTRVSAPQTVERMRPNLPLAQAERIKRELQKDARFDKIQATGLDEAKQEVSSMYREAIERAIEEAGEAAPPGSEVASLAERFVPTKRQLAATIEARDAAERGAGAAAHRVGGAAGVNTFDVAQASQATGSRGLGALGLAMAQRVWKERGPSTMANFYDVGAEAAGNMSRAAYANPETTQALSRAAFGAGGRQVTDSEAVQRAIADYLMQRRAGGGP
jgi:hypothetical protein